MTPLHYLIKFNWPIEVVKYLINKGAKVNARDNYNLTPIQYAIYYKASNEVIMLLITNGADINSNLLNSFTPKITCTIIIQKLFKYYRYLFKYSIKTINRMIKMFEILSKELIFFPQEKRDYERLASLSEAFNNTNFDFLTSNNLKLFNKYVCLIYLSLKEEKNILETAIKEQKFDIKIKLKSGIQPFLFDDHVFHLYKNDIKKYYEYNKGVKLTLLVIKKLISHGNMFNLSLDYVQKYRMLKGICFSHENFYTENGNNILHYLSVLDDWKEFIKEEELNNSELKKSVNKNGWTPFYNSIFNGKMELSILLNSNEQPKKDYFGNSLNFYVKRSAI